MDPNLIAAEYICRLCNTLPRDVVMAEDGHIYCRKCVTETIVADANELLSPVTGKIIGTNLVVPPTIQCLIEKLVATGGVEQKLLGVWAKQSLVEVSAYVRKTKERAEQGSPEHMALLGRWYLLGEQEGIDCNAETGYKWCKEAARQDNADGMAYQGFCLVQGYGIEKNRNEGFELLVEAANYGSGE
jgi:hypothetical protein